MEELGFKKGTEVKLKLSYTQKAVYLDGICADSAHEKLRLHIPHASFVTEGHVLDVAAKSTPSFYANRKGAARLTWLPSPLTDVSGDKIVSKHSVWRFECTGTIPPVNNLQIIAKVLDPQDMSRADSEFNGGEQASTDAAQERAKLGAQVKVPLVQSHPVLSLEFIDGMLSLLDRLEKAVAKLSPETLAGEGAHIEHVSMPLARAAKHLENELHRKVRVAKARVATRPRTAQDDESEDSDGDDDAPLA